MVAKQFISRVFDDFIGEYILNIKKENIKMALVRGKLKMEDVQLDGDLIGSHILGKAVGLSGFGVLSCYARVIRVSVPWKNLEKEPTRIEADGVHLVCIPLLPSTSNRIFGTGTPTDHRCSLRTRAKRSAIARLQRNFFSRRIPDEGPPDIRILRAIKSERKLRKKRSKSANKLNTSQHHQNDGEDEDESDEEREEHLGIKIRKKLFRNLHVKLNNIHVRCEVPEGSLGLGPISETTKKQKKGTKSKYSDTTKRSFAFGVTVETFFWKSANNDWVTGKINWDIQDGKRPRNTGDNEQKLEPDDNRYRKIDVDNAAFYWDDDPPLMVSDYFFSRSENESLINHKFQARVADAMKVMMYKQLPESRIIRSLKEGVDRWDEKSAMSNDHDMHNHIYILNPTDFKIRLCLKNIDKPIPSSCLIELLPCHFNVNLRPSQCQQHKRLRDTMFMQQRIDTMLHQRPKESPSENPRGWWNYTISCVVTRPNSRPWRDVLIICKSRKRYMELVEKKLMNASDEKDGYRGLSIIENLELLALEDLLPIEVLLSFHLLSLRRILNYRLKTKYYGSIVPNKIGDKLIYSLKVKKSISTRLLRSLSLKTKRGTNSSANNSYDLSSSINYVEDEEEKELINAVLKRLNIYGDPMQVSFHIHSITMSLSLLNESNFAPIIKLDVHANCYSKFTKIGSRTVLFNLKNLTVLNCLSDSKEIQLFSMQYVTDKGTILTKPSTTYHSNDHVVIGSQMQMRSNESNLIEGEFDKFNGTSGNGLDDDACLPIHLPNESLCRVIIKTSPGCLSLNIAARPAIVVWNKLCIESLADFFASTSPKLQSVLSGQLRDSATPLAHRAQLALIAPLAIKFKMAIESLKFCIPVSDNEEDGALLISSGRINASFNKPEHVAETHWEINGKNLQVRFVMGSFATIMDNIDQPNLCHNRKRAITTIVSPFPVHVCADLIGEKATINDQTLNYNSGLVYDKIPKGSSQKITCDIGAIFVNLVDVEVLAKAIGKWYVAQVSRVRYLNQFSEKKQKIKQTLQEKKRNKPNEASVSSENRAFDGAYPLELAIHLTKIEMTLEGGHGDPSTIISSVGANSKGKQRKGKNDRIKYTIRFIGLNLVRTAESSKKKIRISIEDVSIVKEKPINSTVDTNFDSTCDLVDEILVRSRVVDGQLHASAISAAGVTVSPTKLHSPSTNSFDVSPIFDGSLKNNMSNQIEIVDIIDVKKENDPIVIFTHVHDREFQMNEVEGDIDSIIVRITATTLRDCTHAVQRIYELIEVATRDLERRTHLRGRIAKIFDAEQKTIENDGKTSKYDEYEHNSMKEHMNDSLLLLKIQMKNTIIIVGTHSTIDSEYLESDNLERKTFAAQLFTNALIMFQSVENPDASGTRTLHVSLNDLSASLINKLDPVSIYECPPILSPLSAEFRATYTTEDLGELLSQDFSLGSESVHICISPFDFQSINELAKGIMPALNIALDKPDSRRLVKTSFGEYVKKGSGVSTTIRLELETLSFLILRHFKSNFGSKPLFDMTAHQIKIMLDGFSSAMSGDFTSTVLINFFNIDDSGWEFVVEPIDSTFQIDQFPNELNLKLTTSKNININLTSMFLRDISEFLILNTRLENLSQNDTSHGMNQSIMMTKPMTSFTSKKLTELCSIVMVNESGFDLFVCANESILNQEHRSEQDSGYCDDYYCLKNEKRLLFNHSLQSESFDEKTNNITNVFQTFSIKLAPKDELSYGEREALTGLQILNTGEDFATIHTMKCKSDENLTSSCLLEPVVEFCMQNQRLQPDLSDIFSLQKGRDLLSAITWGPGEDYLVNPSELGGDYTHITTVHGNWLSPYLQDDPPEWTDKTCNKRKHRDGFFPPNDSWIWANEWEVDVSDTDGKVNDPDGWEYGPDFESFNKSSRFYKKNDTCRRRKWTRTRFFKPPKLIDERKQPISFVWHSIRDTNGNFKITIKSKITIHNHTNMKLSIFAYQCCWDADKIVGSFSTGEALHVPISMLPISYIRLGKIRSSSIISSTNDSLNSYNLSERLMIVPVTPTSISIKRTLIKIGETDSYTNTEAKDLSFLHFLVRLDSHNGISNIYIEPVLKILNLLPCQLLYRLGDNINGENKYVSGYEEESMSRRSFLVNEENKVDIGNDRKCFSINPRLKPHISFRIPGYKWSHWRRIVNRKSAYETWKMTSEDDDLQSLPSCEINDSTDEFKSIVRFEPLHENTQSITVLVSTEYGHCPTIKIHAQYWILDKTGFGLHMTDSFEDILNSIPNKTSSRMSYLLDECCSGNLIRKDKELPGHEWSFGENGMTMFFSSKSTLSVCIRRDCSGGKNIRSKWTNVLDVSNPTPKTVLSLDELHGQRCFEICFTVSLSPSIYARTKLITFYPRYQIMNLLSTELIVAQEGSLDSPVFISPQCSIPFHWNRASSPRKVRFSTHPKSESRSPETNGFIWTNGSVKLDAVGLTSIRLPSHDSTTDYPTIIQVEVRLASKEQDSAIVVAVWNSNETSNPLYLLRNKSSFTVKCSQLVNENVSNDVVPELKSVLSSDTAYVLTRNNAMSTTNYVNLQETDCQEIINGTNHAFMNCSALDCVESRVNSLDAKADNFIWSIPRDSTCTFGFEDPNLPHILQWTCSLGNGGHAIKEGRIGTVKIDNMGDSDIISVKGGAQVGCLMRAEHSTKVIEFFDITDRSLYKLSHESPNVIESFQKKVGQLQNKEMNEIEVSHESGSEDHHDIVSINFKIKLPGLTISIVENIIETNGREILCLSLGDMTTDLAQKKDGYHELELTLMSFQLDNHIYGSLHPVLISNPSVDENEPFLHLSVVRSLQKHSSTYFFRYIAFRILDIGIYLDRRTAETLLSFFEPIRSIRRLHSQQPQEWIRSITQDMADRHLNKGDNVTIGGDPIQDFDITDSGRVYIEHFHLHPIRLSLTFSQEWVDSSSIFEGVQIFQFIQSMPSLTNAPLTFTSFVVSHAFEAPKSLLRILGEHYLSQLAQQIFAILGSLTILDGPADFLGNVGTGVRDFFYEPINGLVHGPEQFLEGLEAGTLSLARGVIVGVVRGAAHVTELLVLNLVGLTDNGFIAERNAHKRSLSDARSRNMLPSTLNESLYQAGARFVHGIKSGALGMLEQPSEYASKYGPAGIAKGVGKGLVGAVLKPMVGLGDAAVVVMNHVTDATSITNTSPKVPTRLRRALRRKIPGHKVNLQLIPYNEDAAEAQKIVTKNETTKDVYIGHVDIFSHLIIASDRSLWTICHKTQERLCLLWDEISHFRMLQGKGMEIFAFSNTGLQLYFFAVDLPSKLIEFNDLLFLQSSKMGNNWDSIYKLKKLPGIRKKQRSHRFGRVNDKIIQVPGDINNEFDIIYTCSNSMRTLGSDSSRFFGQLDEQAWSLIYSFGQLFTALNSRRCIVVGLINGTENDLQIKSTYLEEGGSICHRIASRDYDDEQSVVHPGGAIILFAWGSVPNLLQQGHIYLKVETNAFFGMFSEEKKSTTSLTTLSDYQVQFLEKSYDPSAWWAKFWLLVGH